MMMLDVQFQYDFAPSHLLSVLYNKMTGKKDLKVDVLFMFVLNPRWDMHSLRAKEIKDSPYSQAVPKILVLLKSGTVWFHTGSG